MNKYNSGLKFNFLESVKYNSSLRRSIKQVLTRIGPRPIVLDQEQTALVVLENSFDIVLEQEINGLDEITFSIPFTDVKRDFVKNENLIQMFETLYIIREIQIKKGSSTPSVEVYAEALWYDLQFSDPLEIYEWSDSNPYTILSDILRKTDWSVGTIEVSSRNNLLLDPEKDNILTAITSVRNLYGGDLDFDTIGKKVNLLNENKKHSGASIIYKKNMQEIQASYDTRNLVTRLYLHGKDSLTIEAANNNSKYIENFSYTKKIRVRSIKDERFENPYYLKDWGIKQLEILSKPSASYRITAQDLSNLSGLDHEKFDIGYIVRVYDNELNLDTNTRIMKWSYNVVEPWRTKIELETTIKSLSDLLSTEFIGESSFSSTDSSDKKEMLDLMVFNYLLNSRGDDGFSYWSNTGWDVDPINGYSGPASFRSQGTFGHKKELKQTIYPSHRDSYSLSFRASSSNLIKGPNGRVGVNVKITYDDGSVEDQFIPLTQGG